MTNMVSPFHVTFPFFSKKALRHIEDFYPLFIKSLAKMYGEKFFKKLCKLCVYFKMVWRVTEK